MNTILPKFVDFNNKTAFRLITQNHVYHSVQQYAFYIVAIVILVSLIVAFIHARCHSASYGYRDFLLDVGAGFYFVLVSITPYIMTSDLWRNVLYILVLAISVSFFICWMLAWWISLPNKRGLRLINICKSILVTMGTITITLAGCIYLVNNESNSKNYTMNVAKYNTSGFKIINTNLMAAPYEISTKPTKHENAHNLNPAKNYHKDNYYVYVDLVNSKPKGINNDYLTCKTPINTQTMKFSQAKNNSNHKMDIYYLGQMKNGNFIPNYENIKVVHAFMDYQKYIKAHQLESRFKHHFSFELSYKYLADNENPTLMVVGDNGFTLHYKNAKEFSYSNIVQSKKE